MGEVVQIRDYQRKPRTYSEAALEQMAVAMVAEWVTLGRGIDALVPGNGPAFYGPALVDLIDTAPSEMNPEAS